MAETDQPRAKESLPPSTRRLIRRYLFSLLAIPGVMLAIGGYLLTKWIEAEVRLAGMEATQRAYDQANIRVLALAEETGTARGTLQRASLEADELEKKVTDLTRRIGEVDKLSAALQETDKISNNVAQLLLTSPQLHATINSIANVRPMACYYVTQSVAFNYGQQTRINFDKAAVNAGIQASVGADWKVVIPASGVYLISVAVRSDKVANMRLVLRTSRGVIMGTPPIEDPRSGMMGAQVTTLVQLAQGDAVWVEAAHSMHATAITGGEFNLIYLRAPS
jgi:hypothetical protein